MCWVSSRKVLSHNMIGTFPNRTKDEVEKSVYPWLCVAGHAPEAERLWRKFGSCRSFLTGVLVCLCARTAAT